jgi:hypothetical protein
MDDENRLEMEEVVEQLGGPCQEFRPHPGNVWAARIIGAFCLPVGAMIVFFSLIRGNLAESNFQVILGLGILFVFSGIVTLLRSVRMSSYRLIVCNDGLAESQGGKIQMCRWRETTKIEERIRARRGSSEAHTWTIHYGQDQKLKFDVQTVSDIERLTSLIRAEAEERSIPWYLITES